MPPVQSPKTEPPTPQSATDDSPSRKSRSPQTSEIGVFPTESPAEIEIDWDENATRALADLGASKRALNSVARLALRRALRDAAPLYPALISQLKVHDAAFYQLNLMFTDDANMRNINCETRGKNKPTDVLSFPIWEGETFPFPPEQTSLMLGDAIISIETAARQASELKHDLRVEIAFLAVHGALHLLGYDHDSDAKRRKMFALQDEIVARLREEKGF